MMKSATYRGEYKRSQFKRNERSIKDLIKKGKRTDLDLSGPLV